MAKVKKFGLRVKKPLADVVKTHLEEHWPTLHTIGSTDGQLFIFFDGSRGEIEQIQTFLAGYNAAMKGTMPCP